MRFFILLMSLWISACATTAASKTAELSIGKPMNVSLIELTDSPQAKVVSLSSYAGKVVLVDVWASWCLPCAQAMPQYKEFQNAYQDKGFQFVGVSIDEMPKLALDFLKENQLTQLTMLSDPDGAVFQSKFALSKMPTAFLLDRKGVVRNIHEGFLVSEKGKIRDDIEALLNE